MSDDIRLRLQAALRHIPDGIERASAVFAVDALFNEVAALREENADLKYRVARARASLTEIRTDLEAQMEFWKPDGGKA